MPKLLFYAGTAFCLFLALTSAAESARQLRDGSVAFVTLGGTVPAAKAAWAIVVALLAGLSAAAIFLRMAALVAARNLFAAFVALLSVTASVVALAWVLLLQARMVAVTATRGVLEEMHLVGYLMLGYFLSIALLALRPYFRVQASRILSALVFFPLPLFLLIVAQELFVRPSAAPLPAYSPAQVVFFAVLAALFFAIGVHCIRHRHLFIEMTNLRELLAGRIDPTHPPRPVRVGGVAFDS